MAEETRTPKDQVNLRNHQTIRFRRRDSRPRRNHTWLIPTRALRSALDKKQRFADSQDRRPHADATRSRSVRFFRSRQVARGSKLSRSRRTLQLGKAAPRSHRDNAKKGFDVAFARRSRTAKLPFVTAPTRQVMAAHDAYGRRKAR